MRKWIAAFLLLVAVPLIIFYLRAAKPSDLRLHIQMAVNAKAFVRVFVETNNWGRWWPGEDDASVKSATQLFYKNVSYRLVEKRISSLVFSIKEGNDSVLTVLFVAPFNQDTVILTWQSIIDLNKADIRYSSKWIEKIKADLSAILRKAKLFYANEKHLYAFPMQETKVADSLLLSYSDTLKNYPTPHLYYAWIDRLEKYAARHDARKAGWPMLNVRAVGNAGYFTRVALPIDKQLTGENEIEFKRMPGGGKLLVTEVIGGPTLVEKGFLEMENYMEDHNQVSPAIPFQSLVTDRRLQPDTARWITKLCWPII